MNTATVTLGSIGVEVEVEYTIDKGQNGGWETEPIPPQIDGVYGITHVDDTGRKTPCDTRTLAVLGLLDEINTALDEMLQEGRLD